MQLGEIQLGEMQHFNTTPLGEMQSGEIQFGKCNSPARTKFYGLGYNKTSLPGGIYELEKHSEK